MLGPRAVVVALSAFGLASAQSDSNSTFKIDPSSVDLGERIGWCVGQANACQYLCYSVKDQGCDETTLNFNCTCSNDESPDFNQYRDTMPYYVCQEAFEQCNLLNVGNAAGQRNCTESIQDQCGTEAPVNATTQIGAPTSSAAPSPSETAPPETTGGPSTTSSQAGAVPTHIQYIGNGAAAAAVGLFAYML